MLDEDIHALFEDTDEQLKVVGEVYAECQRTGEGSLRLGPRVKNIVENQRSVLDWLAVRIHKKLASRQKRRSTTPSRGNPMNLRKT